MGTVLGAFPVVLRITTIVLPTTVATIVVIVLRFAWDAAALGVTFSR